MRFYLASAYHLPRRPNAGADLAANIIRAIVDEIGWVSTAHWPFDFRHGETWYAKVAAETDLADIDSASVVLFVPTTATSRGTHVELGYALAREKIVYGWRPDGIEGTAFDTQTQPLPTPIRRIIEREYRKATE